ncbi:MAG: primosomal protein N' [Eubacteriaceae bacterium]|nr:primosomal protein N' [Eubacteriaceae bacterium]
MKYVNLVVDNRSDKTDSFYTYGCEDDSVTVGSRVYVPFARGNRERAAYVFEVADRSEADFKKLKYVARIDAEVSLTEEMIETCVWMKKRYLCRYIDAVKLFTPAGTPSKRGKKRQPFADHEGEKQEIDQLTDEQASAAKKIGDRIKKREHHMFLLHGITGSGKTEVYMQAIGTCLAEGRTAVMLVPEISLTKQIIDRFAGRFGSERIAVLHSRLSQGERYDEWQRIRKGKADIVIGARSAIFAPLENIGVVILDEEHEATYKSDMTPKYETIEVAIKRVRAGGGVIIAGSATPSVVSYERSREGIYERLPLTHRYNSVPLPQVEIADMREELKRGNTSVLSTRLYDEMDRQLAAGRQVILFLNRRGYSTFISCRECGHVMKCPNCGISLTYHKNRNRGVCHYCGYEEVLPEKCPECGSRYIKYFGTGTEKVEETVAELFKDHKTARLDLDTMKKKGAAEKILNDFGEGRTQILTGTQVVAKGLDFRNVGLVGIVAADVSLNIPDYRSPERAFQLITQAAGRAGRGNEKGKVIIQTYTPENYAIEAAAKQDYDCFFKEEIVIRKFMDYPPFSDLIQIVFSGKRENDVYAGAKYWEQQLRMLLGKEEDSCILAPQAVNTVVEREGYKQYMLLKCGKGKRGLYMGALDDIKERTKKEKTDYLVAVDVNPYSLWRN